MSRALPVQGTGVLTWPNTHSTHSGLAEKGPSLSLQDSCPAEEKHWDVKDGKGRKRKTHCNSAGPCWQGLLLDIPLGRKSFTAQDSHLSQALRSWHFPKGVGSHKSKPTTMLNRNDHFRAHWALSGQGRRWTKGA